MPSLDDSVHEMPGRLISIIVCTYNRAESLRRTLTAVRRAVVPSGWDAELVVVDNACDGKTLDTVRNADSGDVSTMYVCEPRRGLSNARNTGLRHSRGKLILFTDDDVVVSEQWIGQMVAALEGEYHAVTGPVMLPEYLNRSWLQSMHKAWLALSEKPLINSETGMPELIGANMGMRRTVLEKVPEFDSELGAGALGFGEDILFGRQLMTCGFRIGFVPAAAVVHHLDPTRLSRRSWLAAAESRGRSEAYIRYHWAHSRIRNPRWNQFSCWVRLRVRRAFRTLRTSCSEQCPAWELSYLMRMQMHAHLRRELQRPRNYTFKGLIKSRHSTAGFGVQPGTSDLHSGRSIFSVQKR